MGTFLIRRVLQAAVLLLIVTFLTFFLIHQAPGGPSILLNPDIPPEEAKLISKSLGLEDPLLVQYVRWLGGLTRLNFGNSYQQTRPVTTVIAQRLPPTLVLAGASLAVSLIVAIPLGILA